MMKYVKIVYPLVVIAVVVGLLLGTAYQLLKPQLEAAAVKEEKDALSRALPTAVSIVSNLAKVGTNDVVYYVCRDSAGSNTGYIFRSSRTGYGGPVVCLTGFTNGSVYTVVVLNMDRETTGLGTLIADTNWLAQFSGKSYGSLPEGKLDFKKKGLDAVTGATYSSLAVALGIRDAYQLYYAIVPGDFIKREIVTNGRTVLTNETTNMDAYSGATKTGGEVTNG